MHIFDDLLVRITAERRLAAQHHLLQDAQRPDVIHFVVCLLREQFGCHLEGRAHNALDPCQPVEAESEVDELALGVLLVLEHDVLGLDVAVHHARVVAMVDAEADLPPAHLGHFLRQVAVLQYFVQQFIPLKQFSHNLNLIRGHVKIEEFINIWAV